MTPRVVEHGGSARAWAIALTRQPSMTGTADEAAFGPWLAAQLSAAFATRHADVWTFPVAPGDARHCVALLVRGGRERRETVVLTGHYDTVSTRDYGDLAGLATDPEALAPALLARLSASPSTPARVRAKADLESGAFLPGRGLLDMKAGLAAGIAAAERFAAAGGPGNVLFLAVPDEEAASSGARRAATELGAIAHAHDLDLIAAVNLDAIADDGDGTRGRVVALGTIGKLLPTAFVVGLPTHAGYPHAGVNAAVLAAAIAARIEWAPELTDLTEGPGTPPSLLTLRDGKAGYDVTTPATSFAAFNVLTVSRTPGEVLDAFDALCRDAVCRTLAELRVRRADFRASPAAIDDVGAVPVMRFETVADHARRSDPTGDHGGSRRARRPDDRDPGAMPHPHRTALARQWARGSGRRDRVRIDPLPADAAIHFAEGQETRDGRCGGDASGRDAARHQHRLRSGVRRHLGHELPRGGRRGIAGTVGAQHAGLGRMGAVAGAGRHRRACPSSMRDPGVATTIRHSNGSTSSTASTCCPTSSRRSCRVS